MYLYYIMVWGQQTGGGFFRKLLGGSWQKEPTLLDNNFKGGKRSKKSIGKTRRKSMIKRRQRSTRRTRRYRKRRR